MWQPRYSKILLRDVSRQMRIGFPDSRQARRRRRLEMEAHDEVVQAYLLGFVMNDICRDVIKETVGLV
jgi:hypothetical protein